MLRKRMDWIILFLLAVAFLVAAKHTPHFPGDIPLAKLIQKANPAGADWAKWITNTATSPISYVLLGITLVAAWLLSHRYAAVLLAAVSFTGVHFMDPLLKSWIARPRPSPTLIHVVGSPSGSSMPSTFILIYTATFGFLLVLTLLEKRRPKGIRILVVILCGLLLLVGSAARVVLGAHWPSDIIVSLLLGFLWVTFVLQFIRYLRAGK